MSSASITPSTVTREGSGTTAMSALEDIPNSFSVIRWYLTALRGATAISISLEGSGATSRFGYTRLTPPATADCLRNSVGTIGDYLVDRILRKRSE